MTDWLQVSSEESEVKVVADWSGVQLPEFENFQTT
jgi:hypothetical protein